MFLWLWYKLTGSCRHKYTTFAKGQCVDSYTGKFTRHYYEQRCDHCGKLREVRL